MSIREHLHSDQESSGTLLKSECLAALRLMPDNSVDSIVTDPPYELGFMNKAWDSSGIAYSVEFWAEALRVVKPGGHLLAAGGSRTYHRLACAIEDAGFEIRDSIMWIFGSGFPKSLDVSKAIDKSAGAKREVLSSGTPVKRMIPGSDQNKTGSWIKDNGREFTPTETAPATPDAQQWQGFGTALKPAVEPFVLARKPLITPVVDVVAEVERQLRAQGVKGGILWA
jgi:site-specific DNA-methyltransferase (adenine-specific)